jgi:hypothetical protein
VLTNARDINNRRDVVGNFGAEAVVRGFLLRDGMLSTIDTPDNVPRMYMFCVSDQGWIVGIQD